MAHHMLAEPAASLERALMDAFLRGLRRQKNGYPESHSDIAAGVREIMRCFFVDDRPAPLESLRDPLPESLAEVYRKALEPLAQLYAQVWGDGFSEADTKTGRLFLIVEPEHKAALRAACRLMGLLREDRVDVKPEAPAG